MKIKEIMTKGPACCGPETRLDKVAHLMAENDCGAIPVVDGTKLIGIVTDRDIVVRAFSKLRNPNDVPVKQIMTTEVLTVDEETEVDAALQLMKERQVRRLPVTRGSKVVGIIAPADLVKFLPPTQFAELVESVCHHMAVARW